MQELRVGVTRVFSSIKDVRPKWTSLSGRGTQVANALVNTIIQLQHIKSGNWGALTAEDAAAITVKLEENIHSQLSQLRDISDEMLELFVNTKTIVSDFADLLCNQLQSRVKSNPDIQLADALPLVKENSTLPLQNLVSLAFEIIDMLERDVFMKRVVTEDICKQSNRDTLTLYIYTWLNSPSIDATRWEEIMEIAAAEGIC